MTQIELAERLGISFQEVRLFESGVRPVPLLLLKRIATVQGVLVESYRDDSVAGGQDGEPTAAN